MHGQPVIKNLRDGGQQTELGFFTVLARSAVVSDVTLVSARWCLV
jgi:hypothetical protein